MIVIACSLAALLALQEASPPATSPGKCDLLDNRCKAKLYEKKAAIAGTPKLRGVYLFVAHRSYLALYERGGDTRDLCEARRLFDASLAVKDQSAGQLASFEALREELAVHERERGVQCASPGKRPEKKAPPIVAEAAAKPGAKPGARAPRTREVAPESAATVAAVAPAFTSVDGVAGTLAPDGSPPLIEVAVPAPASTGVLLPVTARQVEKATAQPGDSIPVVSEVRPGRRLMITGGVTLGVGLALAGVAGYMGGRLMQTNRAAAALLGMIDNFASDEQLARNAELNRDYRRMGPQTLALALAGGATVVVAAVLLGVGGRRMARAASRTALVPVPGGLAFHARF
jgi:hypothetical protein